ncbi:MAG: hypothetical protein CM15mP83_0090 [Flavobacteriaceae bacterium]|nr:MAG: hypothetical protein CM15mP83_0090 [Flavobacteriaceae bacterium]
MKKNLRLQVPPDHIEGVLTTPTFRGVTLLLPVVGVLQHQACPKGYLTTSSKQSLVPMTHASMEEVIYRPIQTPYGRKTKPPPTGVVIDGGKKPR